MSPEVAEHQEQLEAVREAFEREFERFAGFRTGTGTAGLTLGDTESALRDLADLRTRHTGRKSTLAALKKMIGRVPPEERGAFGQRVQQLEGGRVEAIDEAARMLEERAAARRVKR
ncbi:MAG: hypothetical protein LC672_04850, partial [Acidobacteria bacterium]|nr:hypothetical protein [Acidobacteriota bacterium]